MLDNIFWEFSLRGLDLLILGGLKSLISYSANSKLSGRTGGAGYELITIIRYVQIKRGELLTSERNVFSVRGCQCAFRSVSALKCVVSRVF